MLALSLLVVLGCGGLTLLATLLYVLRTGWVAPTIHADATRIVVLGYRLSPDGRPPRLYRQRLQRAAALLAASAVATIYLLGGRARAGGASEAQAGACYLRANGIPAARLRCEDRSRHTLENLRHYRDAFPGAGEQPAALVTSRFHLARAVAMATGMGLRCRPCAAEARRAAVLLRPDRLLAEAVLLHWYFVGSSFARLTGNKRMLARIR